MAGCEVSFPNLGIVFENVPKGIRIFGFPITFYGILIAMGMIVGFCLVLWQAKKTGQNGETYLDFALYAIILSVAGARIYYVAFRWEEYKENLLLILNLRNGGLAIYGGILMAVLTAVVYCRLKKISLWLLLDTGCIGLTAGQIIGRFGNFFNKEAFGGYTDHLFAMAIPWNEAVLSMSDQAIERMAPLVENGMIQVHPTFLYEALWNLGLLCILLVYTRHKKFHGDLFWIYIGGYGLGRLWIEGLRTDQLFLWGTEIPASQLLAFFMVIFGTIFFVRKRWKKKTAL